MQFRHTFLKNKISIIARKMKGVGYYKCLYIFLVPRTIHFLPSNCLFFNDLSMEIYLGKIYQKFSNQRTNGPVKAHLISGPTVSTKTSKIGQVQPRVIIYLYFVELESPMLHAKFQDHRTSGSGEEDF